MEGEKEDPDEGKFMREKELKGRRTRRRKGHGGSRDRGSVLVQEEE